jgi:hypothetical protein
MYLYPPTLDSSASFSDEAMKNLMALEKKRKLAENKLLLWLLVPVLWIISLVIAFSIQSTGVYIFCGIWVFAVLFGIGAFIHVVLPSNEEISNRYKKIVLPELMRLSGINGDYSLAHGLKVDSFLKAGLYHERYSHFERYDSIIAEYSGIKFGLYELAVQIAKTMGGQMSVGTGMGVPQTSMLTNMFYGWVLHVPVRNFSGSTYIIPVRKTSRETDDWIDETRKYFEKEKMQKFQTGSSDFDVVYTVYTTAPMESAALLSPDFRTFLLDAHKLSANAPGFSFTGTRAYMHVGISGAAFDRQPRSKIFPANTGPQMERLRFFGWAMKAMYAAGSKKT